MMSALKSVESCASATPWERSFAAGVIKQDAAGKSISDKQAAVLGKICIRLNVPIDLEMSRFTGTNDRDGTRARNRESGQCPVPFPVPVCPLNVPFAVAGQK
jgi:hypothetical protein